LNAVGDSRNGPGGAVERGGGGLPAIDAKIGLELGFIIFFRVGGSIRE